MKRLFSFILLLTALVLLNAYHKKKHFYPMMVYITKSNYSLAVISLQVIMLVSLIGKLFGRLVFGTLTANEIDALRDRGWIIFADSCFTFATFKSDYEPVFAALIYVFLIFKCAHCIAEERLGYMERTPFLPTIFHTRMVFIIFFLTCVDIWFVSYSLRHLLTKGVSWQTAFGIEYSIMLLHALNLALKYVAFQLEAHRVVHRVGKEIFLLYSAVIMGILKMTLYLSCMGFLLTQNGTPFFLLRHIFSTYDSVKKALLSIILSKKAVRMMDSRFPNATADDLRRFDNVCIICREELAEGDESKVLPCQHIFHRYCLRLWHDESHALQQEYIKIVAK